MEKQNWQQGQQQKLGGQQELGKGMEGKSNHLRLMWSRHFLPGYIFFV